MPAPPQSLAPSGTSLCHSADQAFIFGLIFPPAYQCVYVFLTLKSPLATAPPVYLPSQWKYLKQQHLSLDLLYLLFLPETHCSLVSEATSPKKKKKKVFITLVGTMDAFQLFPLLSELDKISHSAPLDNRACFGLHEQCSPSSQFSFFLFL